MRKMINVLVVNTVGMGYEGISSVILNYTERMDIETYKFYYIVYNNLDEELRERLLKTGKIIQVHNRKKEPLKYYKDLKRIVKEYSFDIIHVHGNSGTMSLETCIAKHKVNKIIVHCHSVTCSHKMLNVMLKKIMMRQADCLLACSDSAGKWLYNDNKYRVLKNAVEPSNFIFSSEQREKYRKKYNVEKKHVIGHVGYFSKLKNQVFLIEVFSRYAEVDNEAVLILFGDGPKKMEICGKVNELGLNEKVIFAGTETDMKSVYSMFDVFAFPSKSESLGLAAVEGQINGLNVIASEYVPIEARCSDKFCRIPLDVEKWTRKLEEIDWKIKDRKIDLQFVRLNGFDINKEVRSLEKIYTE